MLLQFFIAKAVVDKVFAAQKARFKVSDDSHVPLGKVFQASIKRFSDRLVDLLAFAALYNVPLVAVQHLIWLTSENVNASRNGAN